MTIRPSVARAQLEEVGKLLASLENVLDAVQAAAADTIATRVSDRSEPDAMKQIGNAQHALNRLLEALQHARARCVEGRAHVAIARAALSKLHDPPEATA